MTSSEIEVKRLSGDEGAEVYEAVSAIHVSEISEGFLSTLGTDFLSTLYRTLASSDTAFLLVAYEGERIVGMLAGSLDTGQVYKDFAKRAGFKAMRVLLPKMLSWGRVKRVAETLLYPSKKGEDDLPEPEILNFCVLGSEQGKGIGGKLFRAFCEEMKGRGIDQVRIVTGESQKSAQVFYEAKGAMLAKTTEVHKGQSSRIYVFSIKS